MLLERLLLSASVLVFCATTAFAAPITYEIDRTLTNGSPPSCGTGGIAPPCVTYTLTGTVTTDGTLGFWGSTNHFIDIDLTLSDGVNTSALTATNYNTNGSTLISATTDVLQYGYGTPGFSFFDPSDPDSEWGFCGTARGRCWEGANLTATGFFLELPVGPLVSTPSVIGYVPEPGTASLLGAGLLWLAGARRARVRA
jgi:hypothetical protein